AGPELTRPGLADEAIRLGYLLGEMLPDEGQIPALLAPMPLQPPRPGAPGDEHGRLVPLPEQDRSRWHHDDIARGLELLRRLDRRRGDYHLQALIAAEHTTA